MYMIERWDTDRQVTTVERMYNERLVAHVDDAADTVARVKGSTRSRIVLHGAVVIAMLNLL